MRKLFLIWLAMAMVVMKGAIAGGADFKFVVYPVKDKASFFFGFEGDQMTEVTVKIRKPNGECIFTDKIRGEKSARKVYDLSQNGEGKYEVEVSTNNFRESREVVLGKQMPGEPLVANLSPAVVDGRVQVNFLNNDGNNVSIAVYDTQGNEVFRETSANRQYHCLFNFSKAPAGSYTIKIIKAAQEISQVYEVGE